MKESVSVDFYTKSTMIVLNLIQIVPDYKIKIVVILPDKIYIFQKLKILVSID